MFHVALYEPQIPPNTGNIARLCAATGTWLHLIGRLGFQMDDRSLRRAGIDYWSEVQVELHANLEAFENVPSLGQARWFCFSSHARTPYTKVTYQPGDVLMFGNETNGLPAFVRERNPEHLLHIPMPAGKVRCLNLATAAGIVLYEALRQQNIW